MQKRKRRHSAIDMNLAFGKQAQGYVCDKNTHHAHRFKLACIPCSLQFLSIFIAKHKAFILHYIPLFVLDNLLWFFNSVRIGRYLHSFTAPYIHICGWHKKGYQTGNVNDKRNANNKSKNSSHTHTNTSQLFGSCSNHTK